MSREDPIRIQKYVSMCGAASRRRAEELVRAGRVRINGRTAQIGQKVRPGADRVDIDGVPVASGGADRLYIALHKPRGFITTLRDERGRKCISDLIQGVPARVYPVGRLDRESEGLVLLTNDGEMANLLMRPSSHVPKRYYAVIRGRLEDGELEPFRRGMVLDGVKTIPAEAEIAEVKEDRTSVYITLYEGRNRQIRRMCEALGLELMRLKRTAIGPLELGRLPAGRWRELSAEEVEALIEYARKRGGSDG